MRYARQTSLHAQQGWSYPWDGAERRGSKLTSDRSCDRARRNNCS
jgi:hypothetical protein